MQDIRLPTATPFAAALKCQECSLADCKFCQFVPGDMVPRTRTLSRGDRLECVDRGGCLQFWVIVSGHAATCTIFEDGRRQIVSIERPGEIVCGLMAGDGTENWLEALETCVVCDIDFGARATELRADPAFMARSFQLLHRRLERSMAHLSTLGRLDSTERVTLFLGQSAMRKGEGRLVHLALSREDIADYLGLNTETVSRIMSRLKKAGLIKFITPTEYIVPDFDALDRRLPVALAGAGAPATDGGIVA